MSLQTPTVQAAQSTYIIIPAHNRKDITLKCLEQLEANGDLNSFKVLVIDDGSIDGTAGAIQARYPMVHILEGDGNLWWTGAIELGMRYAYEQGAHFIFWLNDDCLVPRNTIKNMIEFISKNPNVIIGAQGVSGESSNQIVFGGKKRNLLHHKFVSCPTGQVMPCDMLSGNLVCFNRKVIDKVGYPNKSLKHYGGDTLYLIMALKAEFQLYVDARTTPIDIPGDSNLHPKSWLLQEGNPLNIIKLVFQPQSILSWRVWWVLLTAEYGAFGMLLFVVKYLQLLPRLLLITGLRIFPLSIRQEIISLKPKILSRLPTNQLN